MKNRISKFRKAKKLTQRQLARLYQLDEKD